MIRYFHDKAVFFDIEYVPDVDAGRRVYADALTPEVSDASVLKYMEMQATGYDPDQNPTPMLKNCFYKVISISAIFRRFKDGQLQVSFKTLPVNETQTEAEIISIFLEWIGDIKPQIFTWAGIQFDLPVLRTRAVMEGIPLPKFFYRPEKPWEGVDLHTKFGSSDNVDLQEILLNTKRMSLHEMATSMRIPGKIGVSGFEVAKMYLDGKIAEIIQYNETDAATTYLVGLKMMKTFGLIEPLAYEAERANFRQILVNRIAQNPYLEKYVQTWDSLEAMK